MLDADRGIFFFNDTATTEIYTLSLHDALPISNACRATARVPSSSSVSTRPKAKRNHCFTTQARTSSAAASRCTSRSEEHTSELQSRQYLVCRLLLEKKNSIRHGRSPRC